MPKHAPLEVPQGCSNLAWIKIADLQDLATAGAPEPEPFSNLQSVTRPPGL